MALSGVENIGVYEDENEGESDVADVEPEIEDEPVVDLTQGTLWSAALADLISPATGPCKLLNYLKQSQGPECTGCNSSFSRSFGFNI